MKIAQKIICTGTLDAASIDRTSEVIAELQQSRNVSSKDILRMRLAVETVLGVWAEELGEETACRLIEVRRFRKTALILQTDGKGVDPTQYQDSLLMSVSSNPNMVAALDLPAEYRYRDGRNELKLHFPAKKASPISHVLFAVFAAIILGGTLRWFVPNFAAAVALQLLVPVSNTITKALCLIAGPLVFMSIVTGIFGVGDASSFGKIGGTLAKRFLLMTFVVAALVWLSVCWLFPVSLSGTTEGKSAISNLFQMILDIVPKDIVSPFQSGNALQIIFIAVAVGIGGIALGDSARELASVVNQINAIIQYLMKGITKLLPAYVFLSLMNLVMTSDISEITGILKPILMIYAVNLLLPLVYGAYASIRSGMPFTNLLKSQYPTFLIGLSTASSSAAFSTNVDCCIKELKIDEKLVRFGIPFGQVLFKPGGVAMFVLLPLFMAKQYQIQITPAWIITMLIVCTVLAVAAPPIPGGGIAAVLILFSQLGIPDSAMALSTAIITFADYAVTASSLVCIQQELLVTAKKLSM